MGHQVALSVVGTECLQASGYFRAKLAQETPIKASPVPHTILRSTQFFPSIEGIIKAGADDARSICRPRSWSLSLPTTWPRLSLRSSSARL